MSRHLSDDDLLILQFYFDEQILRRLDRLEWALARNAEEIHMDLTRLQNDVSADTDVVNSAIGLIGQLAQEIRDAGTDGAALASLADQLEQNKAGLAAAIAASTPGAPSPSVSNSNPVLPTDAAGGSTPDAAATSDTTATT